MLALNKVILMEKIKEKSAAEAKQTELEVIRNTLRFAKPKSEVQRFNFYKLLNREEDDFHMKTLT